MSALNGNAPDAVSIALAMLARNEAPTPLHPGLKKPRLMDWEKIYIRSEEDVRRLFSHGDNVGRLNGEASGNSVDVDLDTREAIALADYFLPETDCMWGHPTKPRSHRIYQIDGALGKTEQWKDVPDGSKKGQELDTFIELRSTGSQTVYPGSINPETGERVAFVQGRCGQGSHVTDEALRTACAKVASGCLCVSLWGQGARHDIALALSGMLLRSGWSADDVADFIEAVAEVAGDEEVADRVRTAHSTGQRLEAGESATGAPTLAQLIGEEAVKRLRHWLKIKKSAEVDPGEPTADLDNARRLAAAYGDVFRCMNGHWYYWVGTHWKIDEDNHAVMTYATWIVDAMRAERGRDRGSIDAGNVRRVNGMLAVASKLDPFWLAAGSMDARPDLYNVQNGTLELNTETGEVRLREHRPEDLCSRISNAEYQEGGEDARLDAYLRYFIVAREGDAWTFDQERMDFLFDLAGASLTGHPKREAAILQGPTNSGKSMWCALLNNEGGGYARSLAYTSLAKERNPHPGGHRDDLAGLEGARVVTIAEIPERFEPDTALFKTMLSGGDKGQYRAMYEHMRGITFTHTLWIATNPNFELPPADEAAYERVYKVDFPRTRPEEERDHLAAHELTASQAVLNAFLSLRVAGFRRFYGAYGRKLRVPASVRTATHELRLAVDPFALFFEECVEFTGEREHFIRRSDMWRQVREYFARQRLRKLRASDREAFDGSVERHGGVPHRSDVVDGNNPVWLGISWVARPTETLIGVM